VIDNYINNGLYDILHITKSSSVQKDFTSYFFSQKFQDTYQNNKQNLSLTVPYDGIPITFGGSNESQDAWLIRQQNQQALSWNFSRQTFEEVYIQRADDSARQNVVQMMQVCFGGNGRVLQVVMDNNGHSVQIQYSYGIVDKNDPLPILVGFVCSTGLACDSTNATYSGQPLITAGQTFSFLWNDNTTVHGSVSLNTSRGSVTSTLDRMIYAPQAILSFNSTHPGYLDAGPVSKVFYPFAVGGQSCNRQPCLPDGKWQAWYTAGTLQAPEINGGAFLRNPQAVCNDPFSSLEQLAFQDANGNILQGASQGPVVTATFREWSNGCTATLSAEQWVLRPLADLVNVLTVTFTNNNMLVVSVPTGATNASLQLSVNNKPITFAVGIDPSDAPQIKLLKTDPTAAVTVYTYIANQSVPSTVVNLLLSRPVRNVNGDSAAAFSLRKKVESQKKGIYILDSPALVG
jgi:hypothetical protein